MKRTYRILAASIALLLLGAADIASAQSKFQLENPLQFPDIAGAVAGFLRVLVMVALPIISFFIVYSGFLFVTAQGNSEALEKARRNLFYVLVGATLILGAWVIATLISGTVSEILR